MLLGVPERPLVVLRSALHVLGTLLVGNAQKAHKGLGIEVRLNVLIFLQRLKDARNWVKAPSGILDESFDLLKAFVSHGGSLVQRANRGSVSTKNQRDARPRAFATLVVCVIRMRRTLWRCHSDHAPERRLSSTEKEPFGTISTDGHF